MSNVQVSPRTFVVPSLDNKNNNKDFADEYKLAAGSSRRDVSDQKAEGKTSMDRSSPVTKSTALVSPQTQKKRQWHAQQQKKNQKAIRFQPQAEQEFFLGGNIRDPLNLNSLCDDEVNRIMNERTPQSSPVPLPSYRQQVEMITPSNLKDPLNLRSIQSSVTKKHRHSNKSKSVDEREKDALFASTSAAADKTDALTQPLNIQVANTSDVNVFEISSATSTVRSSSPTVATAIVASAAISAVLPRYKGRKRQRTTSDGAVILETVEMDESVQRDRISPKKVLTSGGVLQLLPDASEKVVQDTPQKKNNKKQRFSYGNYNRYYGYRNPEQAEDERLRYFQRDWFFGKDVLDIGCNVGHVTSTIARTFQPRRIVGIDIDEHLIDVAKKTVRRSMSEKSAIGFPVSLPITHGPLDTQAISTDIITHHGKGGTFPDNVFFFKGNYVLESDDAVELQREEYDVILALSVTKWVHLNFGDVGIKRLFRRVYRQLRPGGVFIVEPQPLSSYKKRKNLNDTIRRNYNAMQFKPDQFTSYLRSPEVGFNFHYTLAMPMNKAKGFRRPILVFGKAREDGDPNLAHPWAITPLMNIGTLSPLLRGVAHDNEGHHPRSSSIAQFAISSAPVTPCSSCHSYDASCSLCQQRSVDTSPACSTPRYT